MQKRKAHKKSYLSEIRHIENHYMKRKPKARKKESAVERLRRYAKDNQPEQRARIARKNMRLALKMDRERNARIKAKKEKPSKFAYNPERHKEDGKYREKVTLNDKQYWAESFHPTAFQDDIYAVNFYEVGEAADDEHSFNIRVKSTSPMMAVGQALKEKEYKNPIKEPEVIINLGNVDKEKEENLKRLEKANKKYEKSVEKIPLTEDLDAEQTFEMLKKIKPPSSIRTRRHGVRPYNVKRQAFKRHLKDIFEKGQEQYREDMLKLRGK